MNLLYIWSRIIKKIRGSSIKNSRIHKTSKIEAGSQVINTFMDKYSFCGYDCKLLNCRIGKFTSVADGVVIGGTQHPIKWVSTSPVFYKGRDSVKEKFSEYERDEDLITEIGNDVWIGENALIKGGIEIGNGAVIGMGAVVTKNVGEYEIWAGCPAKKIGDRFDMDLKRKLANIEWWNFSDEKLREYAVYIRNPKEFIENINKGDYAEIGNI